MRKLANEELGRITVEQFKTVEKIPVVVVLDNVRSLNNVGSAFRTSDAFRVEKIFLCGITGTPPHRDIQKTALGATDSVSWAHVQDTVHLVKELKAEGYVIIAVEQAEESVMLNDFYAKASSKYCLIFGNEVFGVNPEVINQCDSVIEIPQEGTKHSLNISVSMGILLWEFWKQLKA
ncbi:MAG: RNA methyltransferase [Bacteroidota bacterium]